VVPPAAEESRLIHHQRGGVHVGGQVEHAKAHHSTHRRLLCVPLFGAALHDVKPGIAVSGPCSSSRCFSCTMCTAHHPALPHLPCSMPTAPKPRHINVSASSIRLWHIHSESKRAHVVWAFSAVFPPGQVTARSKQLVGKAFVLCVSAEHCLLA